MVGPILAHVEELAAEPATDMLSVVIPEYVVGHWWEQPLHHRNALRLPARLLFTPGVAVIDVPYLVEAGARSGDVRYGGQSTVLAVLTDPMTQGPAMRQNPQRRAALLDAAIEVLAREGSRGLTLRAVDAEAGVPTGTATNYFANRAQLLVQILHRTRERLVPDPADLTGPLDTKVLLGRLLERMRRERSVHIAMLELRLEGLRRPELQAELAAFQGAELEANIDWHLEAGLPGDRQGVVLLYLAMLGLIVDDLTVPALLEAHPVEGLIETMVERLLPQESAD
ncbi:TetR/AcrR family transcriptional regulator [Streptomyces virginiae]|uniref:TetR/AcrR family transcriptional regulator n=1 Tax=Streptomyces virginiae TaxID=1961 RepID=UPI0036E76C43